jgi:hypothetical protein
MCRGCIEGKGRPDGKRGEEKRREGSKERGRGWEAVGTIRCVLSSSALNLVVSTYIVYRSRERLVGWLVGTCHPVSLSLSNL